MKRKINYLDNPKLLTKKPKNNDCFINKNINNQPIRYLYNSVLLLRINELRQYYNDNNEFPHMDTNIGMWYCLIRNNLYRFDKNIQKTICAYMDSISPSWTFVPYNVKNLSDSSILISHYKLLYLFYDEHNRFPYKGEIFHNTDILQWLEYNIDRFLRY